MGVSALRGAHHGAPWHTTGAYHGMTCVVPCGMWYEVSKFTKRTCLVCSIAMNTYIYYWDTPWYNPWLVAIITHGCPWGNQLIPTIVRPENIEHTSSKRAEHHNTWPKLKNPWLSMGQSTDTGQSASSKYRPYFIEKGRASQHMTQKGRALKSLPSQGNPTNILLALEQNKKCGGIASLPVSTALANAAVGTRATGASSGASCCATRVVNNHHYCSEWSVVVLVGGSRADRAPGEVRRH